MKDEIIWQDSWIDRPRDRQTDNWLNGKIFENKRPNIQFTPVNGASSFRWKILNKKSYKERSAAENELMTTVDAKGYRCWLPLGLGLQMGDHLNKPSPPKSTLSRILDQNEQIPGPWKQLFKNHFKAIFWTNQQQQKKELQDLLPNELKQKKTRRDMEYLMCVVWRLRSSWLNFPVSHFIKQKRF